jgi:hypothetical protein
MNRRNLEARDFAHEATPYFYDRYLGTAAALVREGILRAEQLPGQPGQPKTRASFDAAGRSRRGLRDAWSAPGAVTIYRLKPDWFQVHVVVSSEEQARRRALPGAGDLQRRERAQRELDELPRSAQQYREQCSARVASWLESCRQIFDSRSGGFAASQDALAAFDEAALLMIEAARRAPVGFSEQSRHECIQAIATVYALDAGALVDTFVPPRRPHLVLVASRVPGENDA